MIYLIHTHFFISLECVLLSTAPSLIQADIMRAVGGTYTADSVSWKYITPTQAYTLFHINDIAID